MNFIYAYRNTRNGRVYVGQTENLDKRDYAHIHNNRNVPIDNAIRKYGRETFDYVVIDAADADEQANQKEIFWIAQARAQLGTKMVYNISNGGDASMRGRKHSCETLEKMRLAHLGEKNHNYGKKFPNRINSGQFKLGQKFPNRESTKGKTWKLIDGKRVWLDKAT